MSGDPGTVASSYQARLRAGIRRARLEDRAAVLAFRRQSYAADEVYQDERWFHWCFEQSARASPERPSVWVYRKDGAVLGHAAGLGGDFLVGGRRVPAFWSSELMVSPSLRLRGIGPVIAEAVVEEEGFVLGFEVSPAGRKALVRAGWTDAGDVPSWFHPLDSSAILAARWRPRLGRLAGSLVDLAFSGTSLAVERALALGGLKLSEVEALDARVDEVWRAAAPSYPVIARRDLPYLAWRYGPAYPWPRRYRRFLLTLRGRTLGWAVLREHVLHGLRVGEVVDFLSAPAWTWPLLALCLERLRADGLKAAYCVHRGPAAGSVLHGLGFVRRPRGLRILFRAPALPPAERALLAEPAGWYVTGGDSDFDRPQPEEIERGLPA